MIPIISNLFNLPVTRVEVLKRAKKYKDYELGYAIGEALRDYKIKFIFIFTIFPLFNVDEAKRFGVIFGNYWRHISTWKSSGRMDFLNWLIEQYKDDNENLRKLKL